YSPRASEICHAVLNRGKPGACTFWRAKDYKYTLPVLHARHFERSITRQRKIYYVSYGRYALLYFDVDLHYDWQTLEYGQEAKRLIETLLTRFFGQGVVFWSASTRGFNGYVKVGLQGEEYPAANQLFDRLEKALRLFLAFCKNLADFEIKGKIGY